MSVYIFIRRVRFVGLFCAYAVRNSRINVPKIRVDEPAKDPYSISRSKREPSLGARTSRPHESGQDDRAPSCFEIEME
jgi:hypothetical protein